MLHQNQRKIKGNYLALSASSFSQWYDRNEIGRASCRERVGVGVVGGWV